MKTIFLAAGRSSRLSPLSDKNFLHFGTSPLIFKLLKNAHKGGLKNFIIVGNKENVENIKKICADNIFLNNAKIVIQKNLDLRMAGGILEGLEQVKDDESVFILGGNDFVNPNIYKKILEKSKNADGGILAKKCKKYFPGGYLQIDKNNKIFKIIEKPEPGCEPSDLVNIVAHFFQKAADIKNNLKNASSQKDDIYEIALQKLFEKKKFLAIRYDDYWQAIKYPWHVLSMMEFFLDKQKTKISFKSEIADSASLRGENIVIESGAKIFENATILGPCYIGKNAIVGNNALVRNSIIGENSVAGFNTEIARSFLGKNIDTHIAYIGDSVIDDNVNFGAFSCTANLRLDKQNIFMKVKDQNINSERTKFGAIIGKNAQIGIHSCLMPGTKVGQNCFVKPGEVGKNFLEVL